MINNHKSHTDELINIGILDIAGLAINRSGHLSPNQRRMLYLNSSLWLILAGFDMALLTFFIYFLIAFQRNLTLGIIGIGFIVRLAYMCIENTKPYLKDLQKDKPKTISGRVYKSSATGSGFGGRGQIGYCLLRIEDEVFSISPLTYSHIIHEEHYRVYFVSNSRKIINIEPL